MAQAAGDLSERSPAQWISYTPPCTSQLQAGRESTVMPATYLRELASNKWYCQALIIPAALCQMGHMPNELLVKTGARHARCCAGYSQLGFQESDTPSMYPCSMCLTSISKDHAVRMLAEVLHPAGSGPDRGGQDRGAGRHAQHSGSASRARGRRWAELWALGTVLERA